MNNLIIIDDSACENELRDFVHKYSQQIKLILTEKDYNINLDELLHKLQSDFSGQKIIFIATKHDILKLSLQEISFIQSREDGVIITLTNGTTHPLTKPLVHYKINLKVNEILQVNDQTLVNINAVKAYSFQDDLLSLHGEYTFKVASEYKSIILSAINNIDK